MVTFSRALWATAALACFYSNPLTAQVVSSPVYLGSVAVGSSTAATNLTFNVAATATFSLSYGSEFAVGPASCGGGTCTVPVTFSPVYPGLRKGSMVATVAGSVVAEAPVVGLGLGPQLQIAPGIITTVASKTNQFLASATLFGVAARNASQVYVADSNKHQIFLVDTRSGQVTSIAGSTSGTSGDSGNGGPATSALLNAPSGLAIDAGGNLLIADTGNNKIKRVDVSSGLITTVAGTGAVGSGGDGGPAANAQFNSPGAVAVLSNGDILVSDTINCKVRLISASQGTISTFAGNASNLPGYAGDGGPANAAQLNSPVGLAVDSSNNVYIADVLNNVVRLVSNGTISTYAGQSGGGFAGDGGPATSALLRFPYGVAVDAGGNLYIADDLNYRIRKVTGDASHTISTIAGSSTGGYLGDNGPAINASLAGPTYLSLDDSGNLYAIDSGNGAVRRISASAAPISFPLTSVGTASAAAMTIANTGNQNLSVAQFSFSNNFGSTGGSCGSTPTLLPGASCTVALSFTPTSGGSTSGTINVASNSLNNGAVSQPVVVTQSNGLLFVPVTPCRVVDTRESSLGAFGTPQMAAGSTRTFAIRNSPNCSSVIPAGADVQAYALNVTIVPKGPLNFVSVYPTGSVNGVPNFSLLNSADGRTKANAAIVPANLSDNNRTITAYTTDNTELVLDLDGYFVPQTTTGALAYYPLPPCRVADTRSTTILAAEETRNFPIAGSCNVPSSAQAYALNMTALPQGAIPGNGTPLPWLTAWPAGQTQPLASTLNATTGTVTANGAIVPAGSSGNISVYVKAAANVVIDVSGYFAPASSAPSGLSLYSTTPCRAYDSRFAGSPTGNGTPVNGSANFDIRTGCSVPAAAQSFVLNATVVPTTQLIYITLWARGSAQPLQSTLNSYDAAITSNFALAPTADGFVSAYTAAPTALIFDVFGYFAP